MVDLNSKRLLIIDDDPAYQALILGCLKPLMPESPPWLVFQATNLNDARKLFLQVRMDLVFLDVFVGPDDGILFLSEIRSSEFISNTPVVILSGVTRDIDRIAAQSLKVDGYIEKAFSLDELRQILPTLIPKDWGQPGS